MIVAPFMANEAGYYLAERTNAHLVLFWTVQSSTSILDWAIGQPNNPAYMPFLFFDFQHPMTFLQRAINTIGTFSFHCFRYKLVHNLYIFFLIMANFTSLRNFYVIPLGETLLDQNFPGEERTPLLDLEKDVSLVLSYEHPLIMGGTRPILPNYQYIGMMNCKPSQPLPNDLQDFMESGKEHGVIYVSFGSVLKSKEMTEERRKMFVKVLGSLKQKVLWKWETEEMEDKPPNVKLSKWLPQQDILGHENTRLFISHAGQSSLQESLCHQTPVVRHSVH